MPDHRFYCPEWMPHHPAGDAAETGSASGPDPLILSLGPDEAHHAQRVLRLGAGAPVEVFNGRGAKGWGVIETLRPEVQVRVDRWAHQAPPQPRLTLAVAFPKGGRTDDMVNALSQLGVDEVVPLQTQRGVVDPRAKKLQRLERAAIESAKQAGRAWLLEVGEPASLERVLTRDAQVRLIAQPGGPELTDLPQRLTHAAQALVLIGPEGGWAEQELAQAEAAGCQRWRLGPHVLRIETAALAAAAVVRYLVR